ncbi:MAG TPA: beta-galactosidase [Candidatus Brocadiia bacterium]|nr:beta-galactosidase [Candidatus Brocadiia bacterium]
MGIMRVSLVAPVVLGISASVIFGADNAAQYEEMPIPGFSAPDVWRKHMDGGNPPETAPDAETRHDGKPSLRVTYRNNPPDWGNLVMETSVPPDATALKFRVFKHSATEAAAMHVWLWESDGDAWVQRVSFGSKQIANLEPGWHEATLNIADFNFDPRGKKTRNMLDTVRMLFGCNFGDFSVSIADARWVCRKKGEAPPPPRTKNLQIAQGAAGRMAVWSAGKTGTSQHFSGWGITALEGGDLMDPAVLNAANFDVLFLPESPVFPAGAKQPLLGFLKGGGCMITVGGYAFDSLRNWTGEAWAAQGMGITARQMSAETEITDINGRRGKSGDSMTLFPDAIAIFDPAYHLLDARYARPARGEHIFNSEFRLPAGDFAPGEDAFKGYAATALDDWSNPVFAVRRARYVPLLDSSDAAGRSRGPLGGMLLHYDGPFKGSAWAFFGVTNADLFSKAEIASRLPELAACLKRRIFICEFATELACYRPGEEITAEIKIANFGPGEPDIEVVFDDLSNPGGAALKLKPARGQIASAKINLGLAAAGRDGLRRRAAKILLDGRVIDSMDAGYVVWDGKGPSSEKGITFEGNYFRRGGRSVFMCGSNQTGIMFSTQDENPLTWDDDFRTMSDENLRLLRILHFSPFSSKEPKGLAEEPPLKLQRQTDAILWLAARHGVTVFLTLHDWMGVDLTDEELAAQRKWAAYWTGRYRDAKNIIYDVQNEPAVQLADTPQALTLWNEWLKQRYGSIEKAWKAWGQESISPKELVFRPDNSPPRERDTVAIDRQKYKCFLINRWVKANAEGIRDGDPDAVYTVGYLPSMEPADKVMGAENVCFSNMHYYGPVGRLPGELKFIDRRFEGKGLSIGEFGHQEAHGLRVNGADGTADRESISRFLMTTHYCLGLGGAFACNWDIKDMTGSVFPWGVHHADLVPKPVALAFRNMALLLAMPEPVYRDPGLCFILPDGFRLGAEYSRINGALREAMAELMRVKGDFNVANEDSLDRLPASARWAIWPLAFGASDEAFDRMIAFVRNGGILLVTGDLTVSASRERTRREKVEALGLPVPDPFDPFAEAKLSAKPEWKEIGRGRILYVPMMLELAAPDMVREVYARFLAEGGAPKRALLTDDPDAILFETPTADGGKVMILAAEEGDLRSVKVMTAAGETECRIAGGLPSLLWLDGSGRVLGREEPTAQPDGSLAHSALVGLDGKPLDEAQSLLVLPFLKGRIASPSPAGNTEIAFFDISNHELRQLSAWRRMTADDGGVSCIDMPASLDFAIVCPEGANREAVETARKLLWLR